MVKRANMMQFLTTLTESVNEAMVVNKRVGECLNGIFKDTLQYLDTPRDRQVLKGIIAEITSVRCCKKFRVDWVLQMLRRGSSQNWSDISNFAQHHRW